MLNLFRKPAARALPCPADPAHGKPAATHAAIDNQTGREIARGSLDEMAAYVRAFGLCHVAPLA